MQKVKPNGKPAKPAAPATEKTIKKDGDKKKKDKDGDKKKRPLEANGKRPAEDEGAEKKRPRKLVFMDLNKLDMATLSKCRKHLNMGCPNTTSRIDLIALMSKTIAKTNVDENAVISAFSSKVKQLGQPVKAN